MDPCYIIFAAFCFSPTDLVQVNIFRDRGFVLVGEYKAHTISMVDSHHIRTLNQKKSPKVCVQGFCVYYHQYCEINGESEKCSYTIQRQDFCENIKLSYNSSAKPSNEDWRKDVFLYLDNEREHIINLSQLSDISVAQYPPEYTSRKELLRVVNGCDR